MNTEQKQELGEAEAKVVFVTETDEHEKLNIVNLNEMYNLQNRITTDSKSVSDMMVPKRKKKKRKKAATEFAQDDSQFKFEAESAQAQPDDKQQDAVAVSPRKSRFIRIDIDEAVEPIEMPKKTQSVRQQTGQAIEEEQVAPKDPLTAIQILQMILCHHTLVSNVLYFGLLYILQAMYDEL
jgi:galactose mutarotase-like enzyme